MVIEATFGPTRSTIAGSAARPLSITVTVLKTCRLSANAYDAIVTNANADLTAGAKVTVVCTGASNPFIAIGIGNDASRTVTLQSTSNGGGKLEYEIPKNSVVTRIGTESGSSVFRHGTFPYLRDQTSSLIGGVPARQIPVEGHRDPVIMTVNF